MAKMFSDDFPLCVRLEDAVLLLIMLLSWSLGVCAVYTWVHPCRGNVHANEHVDVNVGWHPQSLLLISWDVVSQLATNIRYLLVQPAVPSTEITDVRCQVQHFTCVLRDHAYTTTILVNEPCPQPLRSPFFMIGFLPYMEGQEAAFRIDQRPIFK